MAEYCDIEFRYAYGVDAGNLYLRARTLASNLMFVSDRVGENAAHFKIVIEDRDRDVCEARRFADAVYAEFDGVRVSLARS